MRRTPSLRSAARFAAIAMAAAMLTGCAQLHLTQGPDQVIQRTESQDNYDVKQVAGPTAARFCLTPCLRNRLMNRGSMLSTG